MSNLIRLIAHLIPLAERAAQSTHFGTLVSLPEDFSSLATPESVEHRRFLNTLSPGELEQLAAVAWIGRGDGEPEDFPWLARYAAEHGSGPGFDSYVAGLPAWLFRAGLEALAGSRAWEQALEHADERRRPEEGGAATAAA